MKNHIQIFLCILLGSTFIISAALKIYPTEPFEYLFVDFGVSNWETAPYMARQFIALELFLGLMVLFMIRLRHFTIPFVIALLFFFEIYLLLQLIREGNSGNCGCFGIYLHITPLQAFIKNIALLLLALIIWVLSNKIEKPGKWKFILIPVFITVSGVLPFTVYPINRTHTSQFAKSKINYKPPLEILYSAKQLDTPHVDLRNGKWIVAFFSASCSHCKMAANKIHIINKINPAIPFYMVINGQPESILDFVKFTHTEKIKHNRLVGKHEFLKLVGPVFPMIMFLENGIVRKKCNHMDLKQVDIEHFLNYQDHPAIAK